MSKKRLPTLNVGDIFMPEIGSITVMVMTWFGVIKDIQADVFEMKYGSNYILFTWPYLSFVYIVDNQKSQFHFKVLAKEKKRKDLDKYRTPSSPYDIQINVESYRGRLF
jgi:hypothetical protein